MGGVMHLTTSGIATVRGHQVVRAVLENHHQTRLAVVNFGGMLQEFSVLDGYERVNLITPSTAMPSASGYNGSALNHVIGRVAGIIEASRFVYQADVWNLPTNYYQHTLNGGPHGFDQQMFTMTTDANQGSVTLTYQAQEAFDGFPGDLLTTVTYRLTEDDCVHVTFTGHQTNQAGVFAPTLNTCFQLGKTQDSSDWHLQINGSQRLVVDALSVPTGLVQTEWDTPLDFTRLRRIGRLPCGGVTFIVPADLKQAAVTIVDPVTRRQVEIYSNRHGLYVGQPKDTNQQPAVGTMMLVPQNLPNSVNIPEFGSISIAVDTPKSYDIIYKYIKSK